MHPILAARDRLLLYLTAWLPVAGLLTGLFVYAGRLRWGEAVFVALPMTLVYAFLCLSAWYLCKAFPLGKTDLLRLFGIHAVAAVISSSLWTLLGLGLATALSALPALAAIDEHFRAQTPLLMGVGILIFILAIVGHYLLSMIESSREAERRILEIKVLAREAELRALRAQIDPHFLFNSLNSISALTAINPAASRTMCQSLAEFLRKSLDLGIRDSIPLEEEFALASSYLAVEQVRLGSRLRVLAEIDEASRSCLVPPLLLQPLMENAIHHGIAHLIEGGEIRLEATRPGERLTIVVENPCDPDRPRSKGGGIGLANVRGRLDTAFGSDAWLEIESGEEHFRVMVSLPAREQVQYERKPARHS
jgi:hypothetical protein